MTAKRVVADDVLGQLARKQNDLFRRVREGTLDPKVVLARVQEIIQNEGEVFDFEKVPMIVSPTGYDIPAMMVDEDFKFWIRKFGFVWNRGQRYESRLFLANKVSKREPVRLRIAKLHEECSIGVIRHYIRKLGFYPAQSWDLVGLLSQCPTFKVVRKHTNFLALADHGSLDWTDSSPRSYAHVKAEDCGRTWSFDTYFPQRDPNEMDQVKVSYYMYIVMREPAVKSKRRSKTASK